ncbi:MAG TPA: YaaR family protein [Syntrophomonadaceae bacterium]|nr:YaaR family protein [Syntrophomonadaceae bacterium]
MKIDREKKGISGYIPSGKSSGPEVKKASAANFEQELLNKRESDQRFRMKELLQEIDRISQRLGRSLNVNDLMLYKRMVKGFLQEATALTYAIKQERGRSRRGRTLLMTISVVDQEVETLIDDFVQKKKEPIEILKVLDKIRGMLVDLII